MTKPEVVRFGDGHYRRVIYGLGPYIADYEEQVLLACIVRSWCPRYIPQFIFDICSDLTFLHTGACRTTKTWTSSRCVAIATIQKHLLKR